MKRLLVVLTVLGLFLAACTPAGPVIVESTQVPSPTPAPSQTPPPPSPTPANLPAVQAALEALAAQLGLSLPEITVVSFEEVEWSDSCLGLVRIDALCAQGVVPGYRVMLEADGKQYKFHTDADGTVVVLAPAVDGTPILGDLPAAVQAAISMLAQHLSVAADQVKLIRYEEREWPNGCLGVEKPGVMCTQQIVPGFLVVVEAGGKQYEFHTNLDGSQVVSADGSVPDGTPEALITAATEKLANILGVNLADIKLVSAQLVDWPDACLGMALPGVGCAQVVTPGFLVVLEVNGVQYEYHTNLDGSVIVPGSLALVWERVGGIAGFCDMLVLYRSGEAHASACAGQTGDDTPVDSVLTADEQTQLNEWLAKFGTVSIKQADPEGVSDAMTVTLTLYGLGTEQPSETENLAMMEFASTVLARVKA